MKTSHLIIICLGLLCSCGKNEEKTQPTKAEELAKSYELAEYFLDKEKVALYSIINNIDKEKVKNVNMDYNVLTEDNWDMDLDFVEKVIDTISQNRNIDRKEVAKIIFSYKYEIVTRDEIINDLSDF